MRADMTWQGRAPQIVIYLLLALALIFVYLVFMAGQFKGLTDVNAMDYAQIGRNIAQGEGFTTNFIKPLSLTRQLSLDRHPDLTYPPIHPWLISVVMHTVGMNDRAVALASGIPFLLTIPLILIFALWLFDSRVAWLAVALYVTNIAMLGYSISGLEVHLLALLVTGLLMVLYQYAQHREYRPLLAAAAGLLVALIYLTKYLWAIILIPILVYVYYVSERRQRAQAMIVLVVVFLVIIAPWCYRMYNVSGNPFFTWRWYETTMTTRTNPGMTLYRSFPEKLTALPTYALQHPVEIYEKFRTGVATLYGVLPKVAGAYVTAFFIVAILVPLGSPNFERVRYLLYGMFALVFLALITVMAGPRLLYPLAPIVTLIAAGFFYRVFLPIIQNMGAREQRRYTALAVGVLLLSQITPMLFSLTARPGPGETTTNEQIVTWTREAKELGGEPIICDVPWLSAWHNDMVSIWVPKSPEDLKRIQEKVGQIPWMLLTPTIARNETTERTQQWAQMWREAIVRDILPRYGFVVQERIGDGSWVLFQKIPTAPFEIEPPESAPPVNSSESES